jgi:hypothetical protein
LCRYTVALRDVLLEKGIMLQSYTPVGLYKLNPVDP